MTHINRREWIKHATTATVAATSLATTADISAQEEKPARIDPERAGAELITPNAQRAINRALQYMARKQIKVGRGKGAFGTTGYSSGVATCSLAGLGFMAAGSPPGQGPYGKNVDL